MADEENKAEQPAQAEQPVATDWEAKYRAAIEHSREWERKAKANKGAAEELERLKASQMSDLERAQKEAEDAKARLAKLEAERERAEAVSRVSEATGVPGELLSADLSTEEGMTAFARALAGYAKRPSAAAIERPGAFDAGATASAGSTCSACCTGSSWAVRSLTRTGRACRCADHSCAGGPVPRGVPADPMLRTCARHTLQTVASASRVAKKHGL